MNELQKQSVKALVYTLEEVRLDVKKTIGLSYDNKAAVHHLHTTIKEIENMLKAAYEDFKFLQEE